ncbi:MAG TPA: DUF2891 domain-containing protein [Alphaproteobacteria bacterium]|nr:DUF2891 domain-containing protein [Alphaproteobacteria bacterium]
MTTHLTPERAAQFMRIAMGHVTQEYPHKADHVFGGDGDIARHRDHHPLFFGSFDWHSCVHGYWTLARLARLFPHVQEADAVRQLLDRMLTKDNVTGEIAYLNRSLSRGFERPYGWAWALALCAELSRHAAPEARRWAEAMRPLGEAFAARFKDFLPLSDYPVRSGVHSSSAFALRLALDYADACGDGVLRAAACERLIQWFGQDRDAQAWEPNGADFLSATLMEAEVMRHVLAPSDYHGWLHGFLPRLAWREPRTLFEPARVSDRSDGQIAHLDGLNLSRAWCWRGIAQGLADEAPLKALLLQTAELHVAASLPHVSGDYMGEHWMASFALLALAGLGS